MNMKAQPVAAMGPPDITAATLGDDESELPNLSEEDIATETFYPAILAA